MTFLPARTDRRTIAMLLPVVVFPFAIYFERPTITTALLLLLYNSTIIAITGNFDLFGTWTLAETSICRYWLDNSIATHKNKYDDDCLVNYTKIISNAWPSAIVRYFIIDSQFWEISLDARRKIIQCVAASNQERHVDPCHYSFRNLRNLSPAWCCSLCIVVCYTRHMFANTPRHPYEQQDTPKTHLTCTFTEVRGATPSVYHLNHPWFAKPSARRWRNLLISSGRNGDRSNNWLIAGRNHRMCGTRVDGANREGFV